MKFSTLIVLLVLTIFQASADQEDYLQWKDYNGEIPENAIPLGSDAANETLYVGRAYYFTAPDDSHFAYDDSEGWIPAALGRGKRSLNITLLNKVYPSSNIQILTTVNNPRLEWRDVDSATFPRIFDSEDVHAVRGGWECYGQLCFNSTLYIGRVDLDESNEIGKVMTYSNIGDYINVACIASKNSVIQFEKFSTLIYYY